MKVLIVMTDEASVVALREQIGLVIANRYPALASVEVQMLTDPQAVLKLNLTGCTAIIIDRALLVREGPLKGFLTDARKHGVHVQIPCDPPLTPCQVQTVVRSTLLALNYWCGKHRAA